MESFTWQEYYLVFCIRVVCLQSIELFWCALLGTCITVERFADGIEATHTHTHIPSPGRFRPPLGQIGLMNPSFVLLSNSYWSMLWCAICEGFVIKWKRNSLQTILHQVYLKKIQMRHLCIAQLKNICVLIIWEHFYGN